MRRYKIFNRLLLVQVLLAACSKSASGPYDLGRVTREDLIQRISVTGTVRGKRKSYIYPTYEGYIRQIKVKLGDSVKEGAPLIYFSQALNEPLGQIHPLRAPFDGVVTQILRSEGEFLSSSNASNSSENAILRMDDLSEYWVDISIPEIDVAKVSVGMESVVRANALQGQSYRAKVREISLSSKESQDRWDRGKVEYPAELLIQNPDSKLKPGMSVVVDIISSRADQVLVLPHEFVQRDGEQYFVTDEAGTVIPIKVGLSNESQVEIVEGLKEGQQVKMIDFKALLKGGAPNGGAARGRNRR